MTNIEINGANELILETGNDDVIIEFGAGTSRVFPRSKTVDIRNLPGIDYVCTAWKITELVEPHTVDLVYSRHFLEHLDYAEFKQTLTAWHTILKTSGIIIAIVPDLMFHIKQFLNPERATTFTNKKRPNLSDEEWALSGFWGGNYDRDGNNPVPWDAHKNGFDFPLMKKYLEQFGFKNIRRVKDTEPNLHVVAIKK